VARTLLSAAFAFGFAFDLDLVFDLVLAFDLADGCEQEPSPALCYIDLSRR
jgi:hypothetical protein